MRRLLITTVVILFLWSITSLTAQASSILQTRSFRTNLVKGEYVEAETEEEEPEESVDDGLDDAPEGIIADPDEIEKLETQEIDEHTDVCTPTDLEPIIDDDTVELEVPIEPGEVTEETYDIPDDIEAEEEENETEIQDS